MEFRPKKIDENKKRDEVNDSSHATDGNYMRKEERNNCQ